MKFFKLGVSVTIPLLIGFFGSLVTMPSIETWYDTLNKTILTPPDWIFAPVWTILFIMIGLSFFFAWEKDFKPNKTKALSIYFVQIGLNLLWSILFFGLQSPTYALIEIFFLLLCIFLNIKIFFRIAPIAGYLLIPYLVWVSFATILNASIVLTN